MTLRAPAFRTLAAIAPLAAAAFVACSDSSPTATATGRMTVQLTDAPFPYDSVARVDIFVVRADAKMADVDSAEAESNTRDEDKGRDGWVTIAEPKAKFELSALRNGVTAPLGIAALPAGTYKAFRLVIDPAQSSVTLKNGTVLTGTSSPGIKFPSAARTGIKIRLAEPVTVPEAKDGVTPPTFVIDFDLNESFVMRGNSLSQEGLLFKPGVKATMTVKQP